MGDIIENLSSGDAKFFADFKDNMRDHLRTVAANPRTTEINELEYRLGKLTSRGFYPKFRMPVFRRVINYLTQKYSGTDTIPIEELHLDVSLDSKANPQLSESLQQTRVRLVGIESIRRFCRTNETVIETKHKRVDTLMKEYDLRIQSSIETPINEKLADRIWEMIRDKRFRKFYRYKKRYSWIPRGGNVKWDLTVVKEASGPSFELSNVLNQPEKYEIEVEYTNPLKIRENIGGPVNVEALERTSQAIEKEVFPYLKELLRVYQESFDIITNSEADRVIDGYRKLVGIPDHQKPYFVGMDVVPLESKHLLPAPITGKMPITDKHATPKADGERQLLYVYNGSNESMKGRIYLINNRLKVMSTGLKSNLTGSLFDSELVKLFTERRAVLLFDTLFISGEDLRESGEKLDLNSRLKFIQDFIPTITGYPPEPLINEEIDRRMEQGKKLFLQQLPPLIQGKEYFKLDIPPDSELTSPLAWNKVILDRDWGYKLDGIIFAPSGIYPTALPKRSRKWHELLKWKPVDQLSNDFLVAIRKDARGKDILYPAPVMGTGERSQNKGIGVELGPEVFGVQEDNRSFKSLILKSFEQQFNRKIFVKFSGSNPFRDGVDNIALVPIQEDGTIRTIEDNHIIYDNSVVEFVWRGGTPPDGHWEPLRFREDKTDLGLPNHLETARSNWKLIVSPITEDMIVGNEPVPREYYAQVDWDIRKLTANMRKFHNQIKRELIKEVAIKVRDETPSDMVKMLDIGTGQAGDLNKWIGNDPKKPLINFVMGIENNLNNLTKPEGAEERYQTKKKVTRTPMVVDFFHADAGRYLNNGAGGITSAERATEPARLQTFFNKHGEGWFDLVSCQFAVHYFAQNDEILGILLYNVFQNLRNGGYFFGTTLIGGEVFDLLKGLEVGQGKSGYVGSIKIWEIIKNYKEDKLEDTGQQILVFNSSINSDPIPEFLVNFTYFFELARKFGLVPVSNEEIPGFESLGKFSELYDVYAKGLPDKFKLKPDEKKYSFLNGYFILKMDDEIANQDANVVFRQKFLDQLDSSKIVLAVPQEEPEVPEVPNILKVPEAGEKKESATPILKKTFIKRRK